MIKTLRRSFRLVAESMAAWGCWFGWHWFSYDPDREPRRIAEWTYETGVRCCWRCGHAERYDCWRDPVTGYEGVDRFKPDDGDWARARWLMGKEFLK